MSLEIRTHNWDDNKGNTKEFIKITREVLGNSIEAKGLERAFLIDMNGGQRDPQLSKDYFAVLFCARARKDVGVQKLPSKMWGYSTKTNGDDFYLFEPSGDGLIVVDPQSESAVAELVGNNLYLLFPAHSEYTGPKAKLEIYRATLKEARILMGSDLPTLEELRSGNFRLPDVAALHRMKKEVSQYRQEVGRQASRALALEEQLRNLGSGNETDRLIDRLRNIPEIKRLSIEDGGMIIETHTMYGVHPRRGTIHEFGEFRISLTFGGNASATFRNTTQRPHGYGHPHVDRENGYWCQGEGSGILKLLSEYEYEAAILFALKAIDSVNNSTGGNYFEILRLFPEVAKREPYPKGRAQLGELTHERFTKLFGGKSGESRTRLEQSIAEVREAIVVGQAKILGGKLAGTLEVLSSLRTIETPCRRVASFIETQINKVRDFPETRSVSIEDDTLQVETAKLKAVEGTSRVRYSIGPFTLRYDFRNGTSTFVSASPAQSRKLGVFQAPQLPDAKGEPPVGQLSATLPELLGSLELETAVRLSLDFLTSFNKKEIVPGALDLFRETT